MPRCLVISAPASGAGKTTLTLALARAWRDRGQAVQCFKSGPDYIDPAFHAVATGRASVNIDSWAMPRQAIEALTARARDADLVLTEGSMGLFDGVATRGRSGTGASADIAEMMGWPVLLVLDPAGQAQTAAAVAAGLRDFREGVGLAGVVLNRVASPRHEDLVRRAMEGAGIRVLGALPRHAPIKLPERHLGLVQAEETTRLDEMIAEAARLVAERVDLDGLVSLAATWMPAAQEAARGMTPPGQRIALARDAAFSFIYPHVLEGRRRCLLAAWRLSGTACRSDRGQPSFPRHAHRLCENAPGARRMRRLHGAGPGPDRRRRRAARDDGTAWSGNQLCHTPHASRLSARRACRRCPGLWRGPAPARP